MKKIVIIAAGSIIALIALSESGILNALLGFFLAGAIPGTGYSVPSTLMLLLLISGIWVILFRLTAIEWLQAYIKKPATTKTTLPRHKKRMPKRRYSQI